MTSAEAVQKGSDLGGTYRTSDGWHFMDGLTLDSAKEFLQWLPEHKYAQPGCSGLQADGTYTVYWRL